MPAGTANAFGEWLKQRRRELNLTRFDLAERAGCAVTGQLLGGQ